MNRLEQGRELFAIASTRLRSHTAIARTIEIGGAGTV